MPLTENHAVTGAPLTAAEYDAHAHLTNAHQDVIGQIPDTSAVPDMHADFTTMSSITAPTSGGTAILSHSRAGSVPVLSGGRYVTNDVASGASSGHWTKGLSDGARIIWAQAEFQMAAGGNPEFVIVLWESNMPSGVLGPLTNRGPAHVIFYQTGWLVQYVDTSLPGLVANIAGRTYTSPPGTAVQTVTVELDVAAQMCYVTGADGARIGVGPDARFGSVPAYYADAEILYNASDTDGRVTVRRFDADSVVGGRTQAAFYSDPLTTKGDLVTRSSTATTRLAVGTDAKILTADSSQSTGLRWGSLPPVFLHSFQNAWAAGQMGTPGYIDRARTFTKIRYVPAIAATGTFTAELRDINTGTTVAGSSATSSASAKYVEVSGTFNLAAGAMPYVYQTATAGTVGLGCDAWLIP